MLVAALDLTNPVTWMVIGVLIEISLVIAAFACGMIISRAQYRALLRFQQMTQPRRGKGGRFVSTRVTGPARAKRKVKITGYQPAPPRGGSSVKPPVTGSGVAPPRAGTPRPFVAPGTPASEFDGLGRCAWCGSAHSPDARCEVLRP